MATCVICGHEAGGDRHDVEGDHGGGAHRAIIPRERMSDDDVQYDRRARAFAERYPVELPAVNRKPGAGTSRRPTFGSLPADEQRWIDLVKKGEVR